jgi:DNA-binding transcriptional LysR family regulator
METRRLAYFLRIALDGSLTRSSEILRIAQPALSRQIRILEEELGLKLFERSARGMHLTDDGILLREAVAGPMRELELGLERVRAAARQTQNNLAIGVPAGLAAMLSAPLALHLAETSSASRVVEGPSGSLGDWLARGMIDLALLEESSGDPRIIEVPGPSLTLMLVGRSDDPRMALPEPIEFAEVAKLPLILSSHHLGMRPLIDDAAARSGIALNLRFHADSAHLACELVQNGLGYAILPQSRLASQNPALAFRKIAEPAIRLEMMIASRRIRSEVGAIADLEMDVFTFLESVARDTGD